MSVSISFNHQREELVMQCRKKHLTTPFKNHWITMLRVGKPLRMLSSHSLLWIYFATDGRFPSEVFFIFIIALLFQYFFWMFIGWKEDNGWCYLKVHFICSMCFKHLCKCPNEHTHTHQPFTPHKVYSQIWCFNCWKWMILLCSMQRSQSEKLYEPCTEYSTVQ